MLLAKLDIKNKLVLIFQEGMNKKNIKNEVKKKQVQKKTVFYITRLNLPKFLVLIQSFLIRSCIFKGLFRH